MVVRDQDRLFALCQLLLPVIKYSKNLIQNYNAQIGDRMGHSLSFWKIYTFSKSMLITFTVLLNQEAGLLLFLRTIQTLAAFTELLSAEPTTVPPLPLLRAWCKEQRSYNDTLHMDLTYFTTLFLMLFLPKNETISQCFVTVAQSHVLQSLSKSDQNIEDSREQHHSWRHFLLPFI